MTYTYCVYVIELDSKVLQNRKFRKENPNGGKRCAYVGHTAHTAEHRFSQHKAGVKFLSGQRWVKRYGLRLRTDLSSGIRYATRAEALQAEVEMAESLRKQGWSVWQR